jgi:hypothetical protein
VDSRSPRTSLMSPAMRIIHPRQGTLKKVSLLSHFISQGKQLMRNGSAHDSWLATTMYGRRGSGSVPRARKRHSPLRRMAVTPTRRKARPAA